jgi:hypothetical protein
VSWCWWLLIGLFGWFATALALGPALGAAMCDPTPPRALLTIVIGVPVGSEPEWVADRAYLAVMAEAGRRGVTPVGPIRYRAAAPILGGTTPDLAAHVVMLRVAVEVEPL